MDLAHSALEVKGEAACSPCSLSQPGEIFLVVEFPLGSGQCLPGGDDASKMKLFFFPFSEVVLSFVVMVVAEIS